MTLTKAKFRKDCLNKLSNTSKHNKLYRDSLVNNKLLKELKHIRNKSVLLYYPLGVEVDLRKVMKIIRKTNNVYLPFMQYQSFKMVPFRLPLHKKKFNILEAGNTIKKINRVDIAIVPTVGVDGKLQRIGFGKGMYDRFFDKLKKKPYTIFIQPEICYTKELVCDSYDVACDLLITPKVNMLSRTRVKK